MEVLMVIVAPVAQAGHSAGAREDMVIRRKAGMWRPFQAAVVRASPRLSRSG
jgi:hypothetical protein